MKMNKKYVSYTCNTVFSMVMLIHCILKRLMLESHVCMTLLSCVCSCSFYDVDPAY